MRRKESESEAEHAEPVSSESMSVDVKGDETGAKRAHQ
jgi:hypothetical protein